MSGGTNLSSEIVLYGWLVRDGMEWGTIIFLICKLHFPDTI